MAIPSNPLWDGLFGSLPGTQARKRAKSKGYTEGDFQENLIDAQNRMRDTGPRAEQEGYEGLKNFDPGAAFKEYSAGAFGDFQHTLGDELERLAGNASAGGRLNTGFYDEDQGELVRDISGDYLNKVNQAALNTAGMDLNRRGSLLNYGTEANNRYLDLIAGNYDRMIAKRNAQQQGGGGFMGFLSKAAPIAAAFL